RAPAIRRASCARKARRRDEQRGSSASQCLRWWGRCWYWTSKAPSVLADHGRLTAKPWRRTPGLLHFSGGVGGGFFGGGFALTPPALGGLEADQRARADAHPRWSPSGPPHLEKHMRCSAQNSLMLIASGGPRIAGTLL